MQTMNIPATDRPVVFYDGACPMCSREIAHYRRLRGAGNVHWLDISKNRGVLPRYGLDYAQVMRRFHVLAPDGQFHQGAYGFVYLWSFIRPYHLLGRLISGLRLTGLLDRGYQRFADWRLRRNCSDGCGIS